MGNMDFKIDNDGTIIRDHSNVSELRCEKCGNIIADDSTYCKYCGAKIISDVIELNDKKGEREGNKNRTLYFSIIALLVSIAACMLISYGLNEQEGDSESDKALEQDFLNISGTENGHEYVDLGLSVKWATCNIGATNPYFFGDYYAWGITEIRPDYDWSSYSYCNNWYYNRITKYCNDSSFGYNGYTDTKTTLDLEDDVAHVKWGGKWRMPTEAEFIELYNSCTWTFTTLNGINGYKVTSNKSGYTDCFIFLPATGFYTESSLKFNGVIGSYWSSSLDTSTPYYALRLYFDSDVINPRGNDNRSNGNPVRPVCP